MKAAMMVAIAVALGVPREDDAVKKELAKFQGEWVVVGAEKGGKKLTEDERKNLSKYFLHKIVVTDDKYTAWISETDKQASEGEPQAIVIDPTKSPKTIVFSEIPAIYSLEGDTLKVCCDGEFSKEASKMPTSFDTSKNEGWYCFVLKRAQKK
jgi:uncharacterized protein (TIGR03067 family)